MEAVDTSTNTDLILCPPKIQLIFETMQTKMKDLFNSTLQLFRTLKSCKVELKKLSRRKTPAQPHYI